MTGFISEYEDKRDKLRKLLISSKLTGLNPTSKDYEKVLAKFSESFYSIYFRGAREFRHNYQDLSLLIQEEAIEGYELVSIIKEIVDRLDNGQIKVENNENLISKLIKLQDHISLEIKRKELLGPVKQQIIESNKNLKSMEESFCKYDNLINQTKNDVLTVKDEATRQSVGTLGIFISIVLSFVGGFAFLMSAIGALKDVAFGRVILTSLVAGEVVISIFFLLFKLVLVVMNYSNAEDKRNNSFTKIYIMIASCMLVLILVLMAFYFISPNHIFWINN